MSTPRIDDAAQRAWFVNCRCHAPSRGDQRKPRALSWFRISCDGTLSKKI